MSGKGTVEEPLERLGDPSWQQEWEPEDPDTPIIRCAALHCGNPAILNLVPDRKGLIWIHRRCWPCAKASYP